MNHRFTLGLVFGTVLGVVATLRIGGRNSSPLTPVPGSVPTPTNTAVRAFSSLPRAFGAQRPRANVGDAAGAPEPVVESRLSRILKGEDEARPTREQVEPYLEANRRSAESLLGAFMVTGDLELLTEAAKNYPNDPRVQFQAATSSRATPEERTRALEALKHAAPDNAFGNYLSAYDHLKAGRRDDAVKELLQATIKPKLSDYSLEFVQNREEAYLAAGWSAGEAKAEAMQSLLIPYASQLKEVGVQVAQLAKDYRQAGDVESAQNLIRLGLGLGQQMQTQLGPQILIDELVGIVIQRKVLEGLDPASAFDTSGRTVQDRLAELNQRRQSIREATADSEPLLRQLNERDAIIYFERSKLYGELEAIRWLRNRQGNP